MPTLRAADLESFVRCLLAAAPAPMDQCAIVARSLVEANLRGHDSHGVMRTPYYVEFIEQGKIKPGAPLEVLAETDAALTCDGGWGFGQVQCRRLLERLVPKARALGVACGAIRRSGHIGRVGEYAEIATAEGVALAAFVNNHGAGPRVAPPGGKEARLSTNPLCVGIPTAGDPIVLDFGTSAVAEGKIRVLHIAGKTCPPGWLIDSEGKPTTDAGVLYRDPAGSIAPLGGGQAYKGFGLALVIDMLAGGLSAGRCMGPQPGAPHGNDAVFILLDPARFGGAECFGTEVKRVVDFVRTCPTIEPDAAILLPGDPERRTSRDRGIHGIPIEQRNWDQLAALARRLGVAPPQLSPV